MYSARAASFCSVESSSHPPSSSSSPLSASAVLPRLPGEDPVHADDAQLALHLLPLFEGDACCGGGTTILGGDEDLREDAEEGVRLEKAVDVPPQDAAGEGEEGAWLAEAEDARDDWAD